MTDYNLHKAACQESRQRYLDSLHPDQGQADWQEALKEARQLITEAVRTSDYLRDVAAALTVDGSHTLALRHMLTPPKSQDQFKLICPEWSKSSEKTGTAVKAATAARVASAFEQWRSRRLTPWLDAKRDPDASELDALLLSTSPLIASQRVATARRNRLAREQEEAVLALLSTKGWTKLTSSLVEQSSDLPKLHYMHKTKFISGIGQSQEVDVACGLGKSIVVAMECKVTNDDTNSVKRINDVLKKAAAWKNHWGNYIRTAAMLQGVMKPEDVKRLLDAGVEVFWSHRLDDFGQWLDASLQ